MRPDLGSGWAEENDTAGERSAEAWEAFFSAEETPEGEPRGNALDERVSDVKARHEDTLLRYPNVVGVASGIRTRAGKATGEWALLVFVERKVPASELGEGEVLPRDVEGIPVDVVEAGKVEPLPS
jgi:hypothetical protein